MGLKPYPSTCMQYNLQSLLQVYRWYYDWWLKKFRPNDLENKRIYLCYLFYQIMGTQKPED